MKGQFCVVAKEIPRALQMETCLLKSLEWLHFFHYLLELFYIRFVAGEVCMPSNGIGRTFLDRGDEKIDSGGPDECWHQGGEQTNKHKKQKIQQTNSGGYLYWHRTVKETMARPLTSSSEEQKTQEHLQTRPRYEKSGRNLQKIHGTRCRRTSLFCHCHQMCWNGMFEVVQNFPIHLTA